MRPPRAGKYRHVVTVQQRNRERNAGGDITSSGWEDVTDIRCQVIQTGDGEEVQGDQVVGIYTHKVKTRYSKITNANRLIFNGRILNVVDAFDMYGCGREFMVRAIEVQDA